MMLASSLPQKRSDEYEWKRNLAMAGNRCSSLLCCMAVCREQAHTESAGTILVVGSAFRTGRTLSVDNACSSDQSVAECSLGSHNASTGRRTSAKVNKEGGYP